MFPFKKKSVQIIKHSDCTAKSEDTYARSYKRLES